MRARASSLPASRCLRSRSSPPIARDASRRCCEVLEDVVPARRSSSHVGHGVRYRPVNVRRTALHVRDERFAQVVGLHVDALRERLDLERLRERRRRRVVELALRRRRARSADRPRSCRRPSRTASSSSAAGTTALTSPSSNASVPLTIFAVNASSFALCTPMRWRSNHDVPKSRLSPRLAKIAEKRARSEHHVRSAASARPSPAPTHSPSTFATTGTGQSWMASTTSASTRMRVGHRAPSARRAAAASPPRRRRRDRRRCRSRRPRR